jgi:NADPH:quinone reductase-like Zn-dependent oxidoreductase
MKATQINEYGEGDVVKINQNVPKPTVTSGKILIETFAASVNPVDWKIREGYIPRGKSAQELPITLGSDFAGIVVEVGADVSNFKKGDEVYGMAGVMHNGSGTFAEFVLVDPKLTAHKPKKVNFIEAAALPLAATSAWQALVDYMKLNKGQKILIHGGSGGLGSVAIQIAHHIGAYIATTVSATNKDYVKSLGANEIIDYQNQDFEKVLHDFDAVFDTVGGNTYEKSFQVLKKNGLIVSMLEQPNKDLMEKYKVKAIHEWTEPTTDRLDKIAKFVDEGIIKINIDKIFPLDQAAQALTYQQKEHPRGKVVIVIKNK